MTREEALKIVRENYPHFGTTEPWLDLEKALATLVPELSESEDEKIRKWLVDYFKEVGKSWIHRDITCEKILEWLEKQKEPTTEELYAEAGTTEKEYIADTMKMVRAMREKQKEQHPFSKFLPNDWVVYDGPLGHAILQVDDVVDGRYTFVDNDSTLLEEDSNKYLRPLTTKDVEKKEEWSEEDEDMIGCIIDDIREAKRTSDKEYFKELCDKEIAWLKSIRCHWKPSEEQMEAFEDVMTYIPEFYKPKSTLASLLRDIKKLM